MNIEENVSLSAYSTMRLGGRAKYLSEVRSKQELTRLLDWARQQDLPTIVIGGGSNIIWADQGYEGLVLVNRFLGFETISIDETKSRFTLGAGEIWDEIVEKTVAMGFSGLEKLSLIPGTVGGTPVQNVGAYGQEIKNVLTSVEAYDKQLGRFVRLANSECAFGYRNSRFKTYDKNRFVITSVNLELSKIPSTPPFYPSLQNYLDEHRITDYSPGNIRHAVIAIRTNKLPDPAKVANNGSFFSNPVIAKGQLKELAQKYPEIPNWRLTDTEYKISAAWLIEQAGFPKGYADAETGIGLWRKQALVVVNNNADSTNDLLLFRQKITGAVRAKFGLTLEMEPELIQGPV